MVPSRAGGEMADWQPTSRSCFVCGRENPVGLKVRWENDRAAGVVRGRVSVPAHFNGYPGVVHGGIVAALLDETAGRAVLLEGGHQDLKVTLKLEVTYRRPTPTDTPLALTGRLLRDTGSRAEAAAELSLPDGTVAARATVLLARPPAQVAARWAEELPHWRVEP